MSVAIDPGALGLRSEPRTVSWDQREVVGPGAHAERVEHGVAFVENTRGVGQKVLPSFAVIPATSAQLMRSAGEVPLASLLHASQSVRLERPLPPAGSLEVRFEITDLVDKGEGRNAFATITGTGTDPASGALVVETAMGLFVRGGGGFGGGNSPRPSTTEVPDREPDAVVEQATREDQALLHRLSGDRNPLHSDPAVAAKLGFERPFLHGLATYGFVTSALVGACCDGDPDRVRALDARFAAPVLPGQTLTTRIWRTDGGAVFRTTAGDEGRPVLDAGSVQIA